MNAAVKLLLLLVCNVAAIVVKGRIFYYGRRSSKGKKDAMLCYVEGTKEQATQVVNEQGLKAESEREGRNNMRKSNIEEEEKANEHWLLERRLFGHCRETRTTDRRLTHVYSIHWVKQARGERTGRVER